MTILHRGVNAYVGAAIMVVAIVSFSISVSDSASAGVIVSPATPSGPGLGFASVPAIITASPNNDNVPGALPDNNIAVPLKRFDFNDFIDLEFVVVPSGGVSEYQVSEFVDNNTGIDWIGYRMQLGFGVGAGFSVGPAGDGLDFDDPTFDTPPSSGAMPVVVLGEDELFFTSGVHGDGAQPYTVRIDVPEGPTGTTYSFTLRQFPVPIPEPSTLILVGLALVGLLQIRRFR